MISNSLTESEELDTPSQILKSIFELRACYLLDPNMCGL